MQVDFTCAQLRALETPKNCAQLRIIPRNSRTVARNGIAIGDPNYKQAENKNWRYKMYRFELIYK